MRSFLFLAPLLWLSASFGARAATNLNNEAAEDAASALLAPSEAHPHSDDDDIIVTAARRGEAQVAAETELDESEIASHGAENIHDLMIRVAPLFGGDASDAVILINGKPVGFDRSILSYPTEALERLAILKPEAASQYGENADRRVVNLVLKKRFAMLHVDASLESPTAGGKLASKLSAARSAISGNSRWNISLRLTQDSALRKTSRDIPRREGLFDGVGVVVGRDGQEIDPLLSAAVGSPVAVAALPNLPSLVEPSVADFVATAGQSHAVDPNAYETLLPQRRSMSFQLGVTRPIGNFSASFSLNASHNSSAGRRGLSMATVAIDADNSWSPFDTDIILIRPLGGTRALRANNNSNAVGASVSVNGNIGNWQTNFGVNFSKSWSNNYVENGLDGLVLENAIDKDVMFNPFGPWGDKFLTETRNNTQSESLSLRFSVRKSILDLPAGPMTWNLAVHHNRHHTMVQTMEAPLALSQMNSFNRHQSGGTMSLNIPITRRGDMASWVGNISLDLSTSVQMATASPMQKRYATNLSWSPADIVELRGGYDRSEVAPSFEQLDAPLVTTTNYIFDYIGQEMAQPIWITGGNPDLRAGRRENFSLSAMLRPLGDQLLTLNFDFRRSLATGSISGFPELNPVIEAAFPERITRDGAGTLVRVDARPINIAYQQETELVSGVAVRLSGRRHAVAAKARAGRVSNARDPWQVSFSLKHRWRLKSALQIRAGVPPIDPFRDTGQSRHLLSTQASIGKSGVGFNLSGDWSQKAKLRSSAQIPNSDFVFTPPLIVNLSAFVQSERIFKIEKANVFLKDVKFSLDIQNVLNRYRRVSFSNGSAPQGYSRYEVDPLGRTARISIRKKF